MTLTGVQGPGSLIVYLQSGDFAEPEVLWDSAEPNPQPVWVDVNTHTHANWVFSKPGRLPGRRSRSTADLVDGRTVSRHARCCASPSADATSTDEAFAAAWRGRARSAAPARDRPPPRPRTVEDGGAVDRW